MTRGGRHEPEYSRREIKHERGRWAYWVVIAVLLVAAVAAGVFVSVSKRGIRTGAGKVGVPSGPAADRAVHISKAAQSWQEFVASAKKKCDVNVSVDYEAFHEYAGQSFGVMVVAWKDSEYEVDVYRYDPDKKDWVIGPFHREYPAIDTGAASKTWDVPQRILDQWIDEADAVVKKKYAGG